MYRANPDRYDSMIYNRCGKSGIRLPFLSLGLWHNFGGEVPFEKAREMVLGAFDLGITHFDLANNYGPPAGSAEETFGAILKKDLAPYRDELIISSKAGYYMWEGPYGEWGSKKNLIASCDQTHWRRWCGRARPSMSASPTINPPRPARPLIFWRRWGCTA